MAIRGRGDMRRAQIEEQNRGLRADLLALAADAMLYRRGSGRIPSATHLPEPTM